MSIYCTTFDLGLEHSLRCKRLRRVGREYRQDDSKPCTCGSCPIKYQGSHILPSDRDERGGHFDLGAIPSHITRNGRDDAPEGRWHSWLRLSVNDETIILTSKQVSGLRDALDLWLDSCNQAVAKEG